MRDLERYTYASEISVHSLEQDIAVMFTRNEWITSVMRDYSFDSFGIQWIGHLEPVRDDVSRVCIIQYAYKHVSTNMTPQLLTGVLLCEAATVDEKTGIRATQRMGRDHHALAEHTLLGTQVGNVSYIGLGKIWKHPETISMQEVEQNLKISYEYAGVIHRQFFTPFLFDIPDIPDPRPLLC